MNDKHCRLMAAARHQRPEPAYFVDPDFFCHRTLLPRGFRPDYPFAGRYPSGQLDKNHRVDSRDEK